MVQYIVLDLEWNQAESSKSSIFKKLPFYLHGEIIQIGAVRLDEDFKPRDEFKADIKPVYFRRMHHKVRQLTGMDKERLKYGLSFETAIEWLREWCGEGECVFLTWGYDDKNIMEQNLLLFGIEGEWMSRWVNLQPIFNVQIGGDGNQKSLKSAMEHFGIEQTRMPHDAQDDAYNTALVCSKMEMPAELEKYGMKLFVTAKPKKPETGNNQETVNAIGLRTYDSLKEAFADEAVAYLRCPKCDGAMDRSPWIGQGDGRYMTLFRCEEHGAFLLRLKFRWDDGKTMLVNRLVYEADDKMQKSYEVKSAKASSRRSKLLKRKRKEKRNR